MIRRQRRMTAGSARWRLGHIRRGSEDPPPSLLLAVLVVSEYGLGETGHSKTNEQITESCKSR